ncbi:phosphatase PAP2 family protein [Alloalcanivorax sp. C16-1]|uniref:phosphatase PAP2 family protein n=1 Tax=Alloalcanivorax sp. C16-1 TaxID=3390051 RepID=UPI003970B9E0
MRQVLIEDGDIITLLLAFSGATWAVAHLYNLENRFSLTIYPRIALIAIGALLGVLFLWRALRLLLVIRPAYPLREMLQEAVAFVRGAGVLRTATLLFCFSLFFSAVSSFKSFIPVINPYHWDGFWLEADRILHGGTDPWRIIHDFVVSLRLTWPINVLYNLWFFLVVGVLFWMIVDHRRPVLRKRFIISYALAWIVNGCLLALLFSSAGPCYFGRLFPGVENPYAPLMTYLAQVSDGQPVWAVATQNYLWELYEKNRFAIGSGISAMPSMHVSLAWLLFLAATRIGRRLAALAFAYSMVILLGSVHLGWHYLVDGYLSIATTTLIWIVVCRCYAGGGSRKPDRTVLWNDPPGEAGRFGRDQARTALTR